MDKKYDHKVHEKKIQDSWDNKKTYAPQNNQGQQYTIDTPPPTVSGSLHIGHIFSYTQTDIIARYKRMNGFSIFYPFGFDDNGLPTERYVEKKRKVSPYKIGRSEFIKVCLEEVELSAQEFTQLWKRMGLSANWDAIYSTISASTRKLSQESFIRLHEKGFIYRKNEPAPYCTSCRTSVAQAELDDAQHDSLFSTIVFKDQEGNNLLIGTTRPELLSSCVAMFYHPDDKRYKHLKNQKAIVPLFEYQIPIYADKRVNPEKGTGLVMCCTFGDSTDIEWYKDFNLNYKQSVGRDGKWGEDTGILAGKKCKEARQIILDTLKNNNLLLEQKPISHVVNVHERCKQEIEYLMLPQWFLNIMSHKKTFIELANQINWHPNFMKARYLDWVNNIGWDWCLSRQRYYGIPFPAWHCQDCNEILLADIETLPIDPQETQYSGSCTTCGSSNIIPDTDVMDTWNTSSLSPYLCHKLYSNVVEGKQVNPLTEPAGTFVPISMRPQAHDIIRTWAFDTIVKVWMHHTTIPWKDIIISGHVLSGDKEKLSKSKEQKALAPIALLEKYPADVIRYWTASGALGQDTAFSETQLKIGQKLITKLWNAFLFLNEHTTTITSVNNLVEVSSPINKWLLHNASNTFDQYKKYFEKNEFSLALGVSEKFFWQTFCDNYLELIKNQLFNPKNYDEQHVQETQATLYHVGLRILQLYAPFVPHVTEVLYQEIYKPNTSTDSLHQTSFANMQQAYMFEQETKIMDHIVDLVVKVRKLKTAKQLSLKTELKNLLLV